MRETWETWEMRETREMRDSKERGAIARQTLPTKLLTPASLDWDERQREN